MKRAPVLALLLVLVPAPAFAGGGGCHSGLPSAQVPTTTITIDHACFTPEAATVAVGATVTWDNASGLDHNISGPGIAYADLPDGAKHTMAFHRAGLYPYACTLHPGMSGVVLVGTLAGAPAAAASPAVQPVAAKTGDGGSYVPLLVGALVVGLVAAYVVSTFGRRAGRVPVTAR